MDKKFEICACGHQRNMHDINGKCLVEDGLGWRCECKGFQLCQNLMNNVIINKNVDAIIENLEKNIEQVIEKRKMFEEREKNVSKLSTETLHSRFNF